MKVYQEPEMIVFETAFEAITNGVDTPLDSGLEIG